MQEGNHVHAAAMTGARNINHWYFASIVETWTPTDHSALVLLGDSITDGRGSTDDSNNRWPNLLLKRKQQQVDSTNDVNTSKISVNNQAAGGNAVVRWCGGAVVRWCGGAVVRGGLGPPLLQRYRRDALQQAGVEYVLIFEGVNDIGSSNTDADELIEAFTTIASDCKQAGLKVFGATITPFGGSSYSSAEHEATRLQINEWILTGGAYDAVIDFSSLLADPAAPGRLRTEYDGGDHLHPTLAGYQRLADAFPLHLFT